MLIRNLTTLVSPDRHVIPIVTGLSSWYWYRKEHQTRLEFLMRGLDLPIQPPSGPIDNTPLDAPARPRSPNYGDVLFRYDGRQRIEELVYQGRIRIGPASFYRSLESDAARADDEVAKHAFIPGEYTRVTTQNGSEIPVRGDIRRTVSTPNYYTLCLSCDWDRALFTDFGADACAVIRNPEAFAARLEAAARPHLPEWYFHYNPVTYFDPYELPQGQYFDAGMCKDFRFAYQREYRFLWFHRQGIEAEEFKYLELGSLTDIAELHA